MAAQFQQLGLQPYGDQNRTKGGDETDTSWVARYPLPDQLTLDYRQTQLMLRLRLRAGPGPYTVVNEQGGQVVRWVNVQFDTWARFAVDSVPESGEVQGMDLRNTKTRLMTRRLP